jgi:predicted nucleic acid-binding protein
MAGMKAVFDTNVLVDFLTGVAAARDELHRFGERAISIVTWAEVLVGAADDVAADTRLFLDGFTVIDVNMAVAERAVAIRRARRIKLPDALIQATAETQGALLVTRNTKDFPPDDPGIRVPYIR